jgi:c-di-GMP-binding flagellar brake protein YcgR
MADASPAESAPMAAVPAASTVDDAPAAVSTAVEAAPAKPPAGAERRQYARKGLRGNGRLLIAGRAPLPIRLTDISAGGLGAVAAVNLALKTACTIQFGVPAKAGASKVLETRAAIALSIFSNAEDGFKVGLQFVGLPPAAANAISQYLG